MTEITQLLADRSAALAAATDRFVADSGEALSRAAEMVRGVVNGGTLFVCGNGGSAAQAVHLEAELVGRFRDDRRPLPSVFLGLSASSVTAIGNDFGGEAVFARPLEALGREGDVLLAISTSGTSPNVVAALRVARERGLHTVLLAGESAPGDLADVVLRFPGRGADVVQDGHQLVIHALMDAVEAIV